MLRDLNSWNQFTLRTADFEYDGSTYPLKPDNDGSWIVYENSSCELIFSNLKWGFQSLPGFLQVLERKAETNSWISGKWWRQASVQYHWYEANNKYYSDFYEFSDMPQLIMTTSAPVLKVVNETYIRDKFGNQYTALAAGFPDISVVQTWEGYASFNSSNRVWGQLSENQLRSIILGWSITITGSIGWDGVGASVWRTGTIGLFGGYYPSAGVSLSVGHTWESPVADYFHAWDWVDDIARYGLPQNDH